MLLQHIEQMLNLVPFNLQLHLLAIRWRQDCPNVEWPRSPEIGRGSSQARQSKSQSFETFSVNFYYMFLYTKTSLVKFTFNNLPLYNNEFFHELGEKRHFIGLNKSLNTCIFYLQKFSQNLLLLKTWPRSPVYKGGNSLASNYCQ